MTDHALDTVLPAAVLGQPWALRRLYDELAPPVNGYLRSRGASAPEDLTSEVFLVVFTRLPEVTGGMAGLRTFVFSVAHARLVDDLRRRSRQPETVEFDPGRYERRATSASAEDQALASMSDESVRAVLGRLPEDQRDVLLMRLVGDLTVDEVAAVMGRSSGAVKQLQRRAVVALREHFSTSGVPL